MNPYDLSGRIALVTGAGRGMGRAVAELLARSGASVVVNDRDQAAAEGVAASLPDRSHLAVGGSVASSREVSSMVKRAVERFGGVHILVNNAGILFPTSVADIAEDEWDRVLDVNLKGTFLCSQAVLPSMREAGWGRIVNVSSTAGKNVSTIGGAHYTASKAGVLGFTRHLAAEVARDGITVNAVCPGLIHTDMVDETISPDRVREYAEAFPIPRLGTPTEVAELVRFLTSEAAGYITGAALDINGGDLMV